MPKAARRGDPIGHSPTMSWLLTGLLIGAGIAIAAVAIVGTGGLAAAAIIGGAAAAGAGLGEFLSTMSWAPKEVVGEITTGSGDVFVNGRPAARASVDITKCSKHPKPPKLLATGSGNVFINGVPAARVGDKTECSADVTDGSGNVFIGGGTVQTNDIAPEDLVPGWVHAALLVVGVASAVVLAGPVIAVAGLAAGMAGGALGGWAGGKVFGEGSDGQKWSMLAGSLVGGWAGGRGGMAAAGKLSSSGGVAGALARPMLPRPPASALATGKPRACITCAKDPVDVATGEFVDWRTDIHIPGVLPIELRRHYGSSRPLPEEGGATSLFGPRWLDNWSVSLRRHADAPRIDYLDDEGVTYTFDTPDDTLDAEHLRAPHLVLRGTRELPVLHDRERGIRLHFEWQGPTARLSGYSDASGNHCEFVHDDGPHGTGHIAALHHSDGWHIELHWRRGRLHSVWLHESDRAPVELVRYQHDEQGRLIHAASHASGRLRYRYDAQHRITGWGDDTDTQVRISYDEAGRVAEVHTPGDLHSGRFHYDPAQGVTQVWDEDPSLPPEQREALCTTYHHNADGVVTCERDPLGHETHTEWDQHLRVISRTDALGRRTRYQHDEAGRLIQIVDPQGRTTAFEYDDEGRLTCVTDPHGRQLDYGYDPAGRLICATDGRGASLYDHDARGRLLAEHTPDGQTTRYHYDEHHRPCGHTAANGAHTAWRQDRLGRIDWQTDPAGATTTYDYEAAGTPDEPLPEGPRAQGHVQPTRVIAPDGGTTQLAYTREGLLAEQTDPRGHRQHWLWGAFDLLAAHTDEQGHTTHYRYGRDARLSELVNAGGQRWRWHYDAAGRLAEQIDYAGRRTRWERDPIGRPLRRTAPDGQTLHYAWDDADRVRAIQASDGTRITYGYDAHDQLAVARVWREQPGQTVLDSELRLAYDAQGQLTEEAHRGAYGAERRIAYRYDDQGRLIGRSGPLGEVAYQHDALGLLKELRTAHGAVHIQRDVLGRETERRSSRPQVPTAAHFRLQQSFDKLGRLVQQRAGSGQGIADAVNRRYHWEHERLLGVDDSRFGNVRWALDAREQIREARYDSAHERIADAAMLAEHPRSLGDRSLHAGQSRERYEYDAVGNLSRQGSEPVSLRYAGDTVVEHGPLRYEWDACGRLISRTETRPGFRPRTWHYEWDAFDRLTRVTTPDGQRWRYSYDAFGRRRGKRCEHWAPPSHRSQQRPQLRQAEYLWDGATLAGQWKVYADGTSEASCEEVQEWHYEPGTFTPLVLVQQRGGHTQMLHVVSDLNGAPRELLAHDGEVVWAAQLGTWGQLSRCHVKDRDRAYAARFAPGYRAAANDPAVDVDLRFANQWEDEESGLFYNLNRYYDPTVGQYISQDPLGPAGGIRTHGYVHNPLTWVDPLGLAGCSHSAKSAKEAHAVISEKWGHKMNPREMRELNAAVERVKARDTSAYPRDGIPYENNPRAYDPTHMTRPDPAQTLNTVGGYREYTVRTPGIGNRGERRIVVNYQEKTAYYSHDHYRSFVDITGWVFK